MSTIADYSPWTRRLSVIMKLAKRLVASLAAATVLTLWACSSDGPVPGPAPLLGRTVDVALSRQILGAGLVDSSGRRLAIQSLHGKIVVISDLLTLCQGTCPLDTANVVAAARRVQSAGLAGRVVFLSITVDPARDTRPRLAAYRRLYAPAPANWLTLTGSTAVLNGLWNRLGVYRKQAPEVGPAPRDWLTDKPLTYDITHSDQVFFLDGRGHKRFQLDGAPHVARGAALPARIRSFLSAEGTRGLAHTDGAAWTLQQELQVLSWLLDRRL